VDYRLFIAVPIPEPVKMEIERAQAELRRDVPAEGIRWTRSEQFHLTLRFLGNVESGHVEALSEKLRVACERFAPLRLRAERIGFFPTDRNPRVIWAGLEETGGRLLELRQAVESAVSGFVPEEDARRFEGHVTLGRVKFISRPEAEQLVARARDLGSRVFGEWMAGQVELIRSVLGSGGSQYDSLARFELRNATA
jgi:RNA 2',3'-cyclic 3'-phosphodiesterase